MSSNLEFRETRCSDSHILSQSVDGFLHAITISTSNYHISGPILVKFVTGNIYVMTYSKREFPEDGFRENHILLENLHEILPLFSTFFL
jgi:hypothetical protein